MRTTTTRTRFLPRCFFFLFFAVAHCNPPAPGPTPTGPNPSPFTNLPPPASAYRDACADSPCGDNAYCAINADKTASCSCPPGFGGDPKVKCSDVNECATPGTCTAPAACVNSLGSYSCVCPPGTEPKGAGCVLPELASASTHGCAIVDVSTEHRLYCWGDDTYGALGITGPQFYEDKAREQASPAREVLAKTDWESVSTGELHTCAIDTSHRLFCWGYNIYGNASTNPFSGQTAPPSQYGTDSDWVRVSAAGSTTCAIKSDGRLFCWGYNGWGQLGQGDTADRPTPTQVGDMRWREVAAGAFHTCGIDMDYNVWCWGYTPNTGVPFASDTTRPVQTSVTNGRHLVVSHYRSCVLSSEDAYCWDYSGGPTLRMSDVSSITIADGESEVSGWSGQQTVTPPTCFLLSGNSHIICTDRTWQNVTYHPLPRDVFAPPGVTFDEIVAGVDSVCARLSTGEVRCWGHNGRGQVGMGATGFHRTPQLVVGATATFVAAGADSTCMLSSNQLSCSGAYFANANMISGFSAKEDTDVLTLISGAWSYVSIQSPGGCAISAADSSLQCWGALARTGSTSVESPLTTAANGAPFIEADVGRTHACAIGADTSLWCWGNNNFHQLSGPDTTTRYFSTTSPPLVAGTGWTSVAVSRYGTCAIKQDGTLYGWGHGYAIADTSGASVTDPTPVIGIVGATAFVQVEAGGNSYCARDMANAAWCWGWAAPGSTPVQFTPPGVAAGDAYEVLDLSVNDENVEAAVVAYAPSGASVEHRIYTWGWNGPLVSNGFTPYAIGGTGWDAGTKVSVGDSHICAMKGTGELYCWGSNERGELANDAGLFLYSESVPLVFP